MESVYARKHLGLTTIMMRITPSMITMIIRIGQIGVGNTTSQPILGVEPMSALYLTGKYISNQNIFFAQQLISKPYVSAVKSFNFQLKSCMGLQPLTRSRHCWRIQRLLWNIFKRQRCPNWDVPKWGNKLWASSKAFFCPATRSNLPQPGMCRIRWRAVVFSRGNLRLLRWCRL